MNLREQTKILCVRFGSAGDVLTIEPAVRALKETNPAARITLLTSPQGRGAGELLPCVDEVLTSLAPWIAPHAEDDLSESHLNDQKLIDHLRGEKFGAAVIFTSHNESPLPAAMVCYLAGIPRRLGHCRENPCDLLTDWALELEPHRTIRQEVRRQLELVATVGCYTADERIRARVSEDIHGKVKERLFAYGLAHGESFVVLQPSSNSNLQNVSMETFASIAREIYEQVGQPILLTGDANDRPLLTAICETAGVPTFNLGGQLSVSEMVAVFSRATVLITNDGTALSVGSAARVPVVTIDLHKNSQFAPWMVPNRNISENLRRKNFLAIDRAEEPLRSVKPEMVTRSTLDLLMELGMSPKDEKAGRNAASIARGVAKDISNGLGLPLLAKATGKLRTLST